jgi:hypothetical protein
LSGFGSASLFFVRGFPIACLFNGVFCCFVDFSARMIPPLAQKEIYQFAAFVDFLLAFCFVLGDDGMDG